MNTLSNAVPKGSLSLTGELLVAPDAQIVYVQQEDILFAQLTVQETLDTSATLRLGDFSATHAKAKTRMRDPVEEHSRRRVTSLPMMVSKHELSGSPGGTQVQHTTFSVSDSFGIDINIDSLINVSAKEMHDATDAPSREKPLGKARSVVEMLILDLNLKKARDTKVGDAKTRGISGGEKKRLCIGNECIGTGLMGGRRAGNTVIFADEPTSGLDSYQAQRVVELLKSMATAGDCTVVASIHQPRASIVSLFDDITLVAEGRCVYTGTVTEMPHWFKSLGHPCPPGVNAAEFYIDLISIDNSSPEEERRCRQRIDRLSEAFLRKRTGWTERRGELAKLLAKGASGAAAVARVAAPAGRRVALPVRGGGVAAVARALRGAAAGVRRGTRTFAVLLRRAWRQVTLCEHRPDTHTHTHTLERTPHNPLFASPPRRSLARRSAATRR